jgi:predicted transcriptional regulator
MPNKSIRPRILMALKQGPLETWQIVARVGCSRSTMVHILRQLIDEGLVEKRDQFKFAVYAITLKGLESCTK